MYLTLLMQTNEGFIHGSYLTEAPKNPGFYFQHTAKCIVKGK